MASVIKEHEANLQVVDSSCSEVLFPEAVDAWIIYLEAEKRVKPSTLAGYNKLLVRPGGSRDLRRGRIMREFEIAAAIAAAAAAVPARANCRNP
jgi:hypothetical protein